MFFNKTKQQQIEEEFAEYRRQVSLCLAGAANSIKRHAQCGDFNDLRENVATVHRYEGKADDIRRSLEDKMYSQALFPESRGDLVGLLEAIDRVPNRAESVVRMLMTHHLLVPDDLKAGIIELADICRRCTDALLEGAENLFSNYTAATVAVGKVDELESEADHLESALTERVFTGPWDGAYRILLRDLIERLASVTDCAESAGDRIRITVAKRGI